MPQAPRRSRHPTCSRLFSGRPGGALAVATQLVYRSLRRPLTPSPPRCPPRGAQGPSPTRVESGAGPPAGERGGRGVRAEAARVATPLGVIGLAIAGAVVLTANHPPARLLLAFA